MKTDVFMFLLDKMIKDLLIFHGLQVRFVDKRKPKKENSFLTLTRFPTKQTIYSDDTSVSRNNKNFRKVNWGQRWRDEAKSDKKGNKIMTARQRKKDGR